MILYSENEIKMFAKLNFLDFIEHVEPAVLYRMAVETCFIENKTGPHVDALRRAAKAFLVESTPYRMTPEFDSLVSFVP